MNKKVLSIVGFLFLLVLMVPTTEGLNVLFYDVTLTEFSEDGVVIYVECPANNSILGKNTEIRIVSFNQSHNIDISTGEVNMTILGNENYPISKYKVLTIKSPTETFNFTIKYNDTTVLHYTYIHKKNIVTAPNTQSTQDTVEAFEEAEDDLIELIEEQEEEVEQLEKEARTLPWEEHIELIYQFLILSFFAGLFGVAFAKFSAKRIPRIEHNMRTNGLMKLMIFVFFTSIILYSIYRFGSMAVNMKQQQDLEMLIDLYIQQGVWTPEQKAGLMNQVQEMYPVNVSQVYYDTIELGLYIFIIFTFLSIFTYTIKRENRPEGAVDIFETKVRGPRERATEDILCENNRGIMIRDETNPDIWYFFEEDTTLKSAILQLLGFDKGIKMILLSDGPTRLLRAKINNLDAIFVDKLERRKINDPIVEQALIDKQLIFHKKPTKVPSLFGRILLKWQHNKGVQDDSVEEIVVAHLSKYHSAKFRDVIDINHAQNTDELIGQVGSILSQKEGFEAFSVYSKISRNLFNIFHHMLDALHLKREDKDKVEEVRKRVDDIDRLPKDLSQEYNKSNESSRPVSGYRKSKPGDDVIG